MKNFLEKDLETIIWNNYEHCESKGLKIDQPFYKHGKLYRQLNLTPYGIADLVCIRFVPANNAYYVQVIELKKDKVDASAYAQAKRYLTALASLLKKNKTDTGASYTIYSQIVLIGTSVEAAGDFVFCLNADNACAAFTYSYGFNGIEFTRVGREWVITSADSSNTLEALGAQLLEYECKCWGEHYTEIAEAEEIEAERMLAHGDYSNALLITSQGVLLNTEWLMLPDGLTDEEDGAE